MNWSPGGGVDATVGLNVGNQEPVSLRVNRDGGAYLVIGDSVEIILAPAHVAALREQSGAVLADLVALEEAEGKAVEAQAIGEQAVRSADYARQQANRAMAAGATQQAQTARTAAGKAADAAALVESAVQATFAAIETAEEAMEDAGEAAAAAARAASETTKDDAGSPADNTSGAAAGHPLRLL